MHRKITSYLLAIVTSFFATHPTAAQSMTNSFNLMPMPAHIEATGEKFHLPDSFRVAVSGNPHARLYAGATRFLRRLAGRTGFFLPQDQITPHDTVQAPDLRIRCQRPGKVALSEDESYSLQISASGIELQAVTDLGALHGLETLLQLLAADSSGYFFPGVRIDDRPRFPWRGLMIDASRHFQPVEVIKRNLDGMAAVKLNVLHLHLSDDQGFRIESKVYPKLHEMGSDGQYYTQAQIRDLIAYADARGIRVVPEFDVPGHTTSWLVGYPELGSAPGPYKIERTWGIQYPVLNPAKKSTYKFLDKFFGEMAALFPDPYFHIGGDEVEAPGYHEAKHWNENPEIQAFMKKHHLADNAALQAYFNQKVLKILTKHRKIMVGWDEILHKDMPTNIVIQSWRGRDAMIKAAQKGYQSILSNGYYIDLNQPTDFHYLNDPLPADTPLTEEEQKLILGGETTMWAEFVSPENIDSRIWPRTAAIAERFWSPREVNDVHDMYRRLDKISLELEEHGLTHVKNYGMMLRRLCRGYDIAALQTLVDVIEPVKIYKRNQLRPHTSTSPLTRAVDAAHPDAKVAREFRWDVEQYLQDPTANAALAASLQARLQTWQENHEKLVPVIRRSPILREIEPLSQDLQDMATIGLQALALFTEEKSPSPGWQQQAEAAIARAKEPQAQVELMILPAIEQLVQAVSK